MRNVRAVVALMSFFAWIAAGGTSGCGGSSGWNGNSGNGSDAGTEAETASGTSTASSGAAEGGAVEVPASGGGSTLTLRPPDGGSSSSAPSSCTSRGQCVNWSCPNAGHTTIHGTVYDPAGLDPLYDVAVYVPQSPPAPLPAGASCSTCESLYTGGVVAGALTDADGNFSIVDAPTGTGVPLVVQIGKWRRQYEDRRGGLRGHSRGGAPPARERERGRPAEHRRIDGWSRFTGVPPAADRRGHGRRRRHR